VRKYRFAPNVSDHGRSGDRVLEPEDNLRDGPELDHAKGDGSEADVDCVNVSK